VGEVWKTATSAFENIKDIDFVGISKELKSVLVHLNRGLGDLDFKQINTDMLMAFHSIHDLASMPALHRSIDQLNVWLDRMNEHIDPLADDVHDTLKVARHTLSSAQKSFQALEQALDTNSPMGYDVQTTLQSFQDACCAVERFADMLERNPSALIFGKN